MDSTFPSNSTSFGSPMPTRVWSNTGTKYKYGFNSHEKDNEMNVDGGDYDYGARIYDSRLGRWLSVDPLANKGPQYSPYCYTINNPLNLTDPDGKWPDLPSLNSVKQFAIGYGTSLVQIAEGGQIHKQVLASVSLAVNISTSVMNGDYQGVKTQLWNSTGIPATINTVKSAVNGDPKALGQALATLTVMAVVHKAGGTTTNGSQTISKVAPIVETTTSLLDDAIVVRGGRCLADNFSNGTGVKTAPNGTLSGVSVSSSNTATWGQLAKGVRHGQVGTTTVGKVRAAGGQVTPSPTPQNPFHATLSGVTPMQAQKLFLPTVQKPIL